MLPVWIASVVAVAALYGLFRMGVGLRLLGGTVVLLLLLGATTPMFRHPLVTLAVLAAVPLMAREWQARRETVASAEKR